jgi:hypothetical protein
LNLAAVDLEAASGEGGAMRTFLVTAGLYSAKLRRYASAIWDVRRYLA